MNEAECPKCGVICNDPRLKHCLLCGASLVATQTVEEPPKSEKVEEIEKELKAIQVEDDKVPQFNDKGGFSKKNSKKKLDIEQLQADNKALKKELGTFEEIYKKEHPVGKPWYTSVGSWFVIILVLGLFYLIYWFWKTQGGLPHEFYELLRRIKL